MLNRTALSGFTLVELLISLAIIGQIAAFTIPKVISAQQNSQNQARAKQVFSTISSAFQTYTMENALNSSMNIKDLSQYMNYVKVDTTSTLDGSPNDSLSYSCNSRVCLKMHSGAIVAFGAIGSFGGATNLNMQWFLIDPDGTYAGDSSSVWGVIYYNGRVTSWANIAANSQDGGGTYNPGNYDPSWFSW